MKTIAVVTPNMKFWNLWLQEFIKPTDNVLVYSNGTATINGDRYYFCNDISKVRGQRCDDYVTYGNLGTINRVDEMLEILELKIKDAQK